MLPTDSRALRKTEKRCTQKSARIVKGNYRRSLIYWQSEDRVKLQMSAIAIKAMRSVLRVIRDNLRGLSLKGVTPEALRNHVDASLDTGMSLTAPLLLAWEHAPHSVKILRTTPAPMIVVIETEFHVLNNSGPFLNPTGEPWCGSLSEFPKISRYFNRFTLYIRANWSTNQLEVIEVRGAKPAVKRRPRLKRLKRRLAIRE